VNSLFVLLGIENWKPVLTSLILPPVPLFVLALIGGWLLGRRSRAGWPTLGAAVVLLWLTASSAPADFVARFGLPREPALKIERIRELKAEAAGHKPFAIVVLGGGVEALAPEYGTSTLQPISVERLRYGIWLARLTGAPLAFSGGVGHAQKHKSVSEAEAAARIAREEFGSGIARHPGERGAHRCAPETGRHRSHRARDPRAAHAARVAGVSRGRRLGDAHRRRADEPVR
jgi:hypothetical protein